MSAHVLVVCVLTLNKGRAFCPTIVRSDDIENQRNYCEKACN